MISLDLETDLNPWLCIHLAAVIIKPWRWAMKKTCAVVLYLWLALLAICCSVTSAEEQKSTVSITQATNGTELTLNLSVICREQPVACVTGFLGFDRNVVRFKQGAVNRAAFSNDLVTADPAEKQAGVVSFFAGAAEPLSASEVGVVKLCFERVAEGDLGARILCGWPYTSGALDAAFRPVPTSFEGLPVLENPEPVHGLTEHTR
jgi:hypothetical protein